jgi:hypothetical protein
MTCSDSAFVPSDKMSAMFPSLRHLIDWIISAFCSCQDLILENLALRQQLLALHAKRPRRRLSARQKLFWVGLRKLARMEEAPHLGDPENRSRVASRWFSALLEVALQS